MLAVAEARSYPAPAVQRSRPRQSAAPPATPAVAPLPYGPPSTSPRGPKTQRTLLLPLLALVLAACGGGEPPADDTAGEAFAGAEAADAAPTEDDVRDLITRREEASATGVGSMHSGVALAFDEVRFGTPRAADERDRVVNGITGATVYPVRVRYTSNRTWGNGETEAKPIHYDYEFHRDAQGGWDAYLVGPVR